MTKLIVSLKLNLSNETNLIETNDREDELKYKPKDNDKHVEDALMQAFGKNCDSSKNQLLITFLNELNLSLKSCKLC